MTDTPVAKQPPLTLRFLGSLLRLMPKGRHLVCRRAVSLMSDKGPYRVRFDEGQSVMAVDLNDVLGRYVLVDGFWEPIVTSVFLHLLEPGQTLIDVGAHSGYFTLLAARRIRPGGKIVAFEPDAKNRKHLADNLALNGCGDIAVEPLAVSASDGNVLFEPSNEQNSGAANVVEPQQAGVRSQMESIRAVSLDTYCREKNIRRVDLVKMDIEGGEAQAIEGMRQGLSDGFYRRILMELHPGCLRAKNRDPRDVLSVLIDNGYSCRRLVGRVRGIFGRRVPVYDPGMLAPFDGTIPEPPSHFLFTAKGVASPS